MHRKPTRPASGGSGRTVYLGKDRKVRIASTGVRSRRPQNEAGRLWNFWTHALSPGAVFCGLVGVLLGRAKLFGASSPFGIAYLGVVAACRGPFAPLTAFGTLIGVTGLTLTSDAIWSIIPLILVVVFARVFSRRVEARPFLLPISITIFGFLAPEFLKVVFGASQPSIAIVAFEAVIGGLAAAIFSWGGIGRGFSALPQWGALGPEQAASFGLLCAGITMGLAGIEFHGISLGTVVAGIATTAIAYSGGATFGAAAGALTGLACAVSGQGLMPIVGAYALGGLLAGSMRSYGKVASAIGFVAGAGLLVFQVSSRGDVLLFAAELGISGLLFLCIPRKGLQQIAKVLRLCTKIQSKREVHARRVRNFCLRNL